MPAIHPQFIKAGDEELVVLTRAEFDRLMEIAAREEAEDAEDVALFDARVAEFGSGADAALPLDVSAMILAGERSLAALRRWRGLSPGALAAAANLDVTRLESLEMAKALPSEAERFDLARALEIDPRWLG